MPEPTVAPVAHAPVAPTPRSVLQVAAEAAKGWMEDAAMSLSAAISFTTVVSLAPLLLLVVSIAGMFWGNQPEVVQERLLMELRSLVGASGADVVETALRNAERPGEGGVLATIAGIATLLIGATALFAQ
ncbi:MAG TPA: YhjD/YihY/BrkB family envelope integrity protein, partial [Rhodothermales bacterium]|nr:YhjD/YihY/BrkB family envelope integrity protein [Rhodothermales bacterium]